MNNNKQILVNALNNTRLRQEGLAVIESIADYLLTQDIKPTQHGEWIATIETIGTIHLDCVKCTTCGYKWLMDKEYDLEFYKEQWKYCPSCGSYMDNGDANINIIE